MSEDTPRKEPTSEQLRQMLLAGGFVLRYPDYAGLLSRIAVKADPGVAVMAVSARRGIRGARVARRFTLHVNPRFVEEQPEFIAGVLLHELHHVMLGHTTDVRFRHAAHPRLMEYAMEASANEFISEPLPGIPITIEALSKYGVKPFQSTLERYRALVAALPSSPELGELRLEITGDHLPDGVGRVREHENRLRVRGDRRRDRVREKTAQAGDGGVDAGMLIEELRGGTSQPPRIDWREVLRRFVTPERERTADWRRVPRRFPDRLGIVPGRGQRPNDEISPSVLVAIDTSASITTQELEAIGAELVGLMEVAKLTVIECDKQIRAAYPFEGELSAAHGRGGTDLRPPFAPEILAEHAPDCVVYFTDGDGPTLAEAPDVRTLWVLTKGDKGFGCEWGERVVM